jgi:hypothetical protein
VRREAHERRRLEADKRRRRRDLQDAGRRKERGRLEDLRRVEVAEVRERPVVVGRQAGVGDSSCVAILAGGVGHDELDARGAAPLELELRSTQDVSSLRARRPLSGRLA